MCCRRRERRAPVLVVLGKMAYEKYQERKASKFETSGGWEISPETLEHEANSEILEKAGIAPPSYEDVVSNRGMVARQHLAINEKAFDFKAEASDYSDAESFNEVANGFQHADVSRSAAPAVSASAWNRYGAKGSSSCQSNCERKRADRLARKAEKEAAKRAAKQLRV